MIYCGKGGFHFCTKSTSSDPSSGTDCTPPRRPVRELYKDSTERKSFVRFLKPITFDSNVGQIKIQPINSKCRPPPVAEVCAKVSEKTRYLLKSEKSISGESGSESSEEISNINSSREISKTISSKSFPSTSLTSGPASQATTRPSSVCCNRRRYRPQNSCCSPMSSQSCVRVCRPRVSTYSKERIPPEPSKESQQSEISATSESSSEEEEEEIKEKSSHELTEPEAPRSKLIYKSSYDPPSSLLQTPTAVVEVPSPPLEEISPALPAAEPVKLHTKENTAKPLIELPQVISAQHVSKSKTKPLSQIQPILPPKTHTKRPTELLQRSPIQTSSVSTPLESPIDTPPDSPTLTILGSPANLPPEKSVEIPPSTHVNTASGTSSETPLVVISDSPPEIISHAPHARTHAVMVREPLIVTSTESPPELAPQAPPTVTQETRRRSKCRKKPTWPCKKRLMGEIPKPALESPPEITAEQSPEIVADMSSVMIPVMSPPSSQKSSKPPLSLKTFSKPPIKSSYLEPVKQQTIPVKKSFKSRPLSVRQSRKPKSYKSLKTIPPTTYQTLPKASELPVEVSEPPMEASEPPTEASEPPTEASEPPTEVCSEAPLEVCSETSAEITPEVLPQPIKTTLKSLARTPTKAPTKVLTKAPTKTPTKAPTKVPTKVPTKAPTKVATKIPTESTPETQPESPLESLPEENVKPPLSKSSKVTPPAPSLQEKDDSTTDKCMSEIKDFCRRLDLLGCFREKFKSEKVRKSIRDQLKASPTSDPACEGFKSLFQCGDYGNTPCRRALGRAQCMSKMRMMQRASSNCCEYSHLGCRPHSVRCPGCHTEVITTVNYVVGLRTHLCALCLYLCGCCPCAILPYMINFFKVPQHYCSDCGTLVGVQELSFPF